MAEDKKGFILYADQKELFDQLSSDKAGKLIKHIFAYVNDENPQTDDLIINIAFTPIKNQLKRDLVKYEEKRDKKSISGREGNLKRWHLDLFNEYSKGVYTLERAEIIAKGRKVSHPDKVQSHPIAKIAVNVNDNVTVNDKVNDNVKESKEAVFKKNLLTFQENYPLEMLEKFFLYWTEKNPNGKKMKFEMQKTFDIERRLLTWSKNEKNFNGNSNGKMTLERKQELNRNILSELMEGKK